MRYQPHQIMNRLCPANINRATIWVMILTHILICVLSLCLLLWLQFTDDLTVAICSDSGGSVFELEMK